MKATSLLIALTITLSAQTQVLSWAKPLKGASSEASYSIVVDAAGNQYTTGSFTGTTDFDPGPGVTELIAAGDQDVFVCKLDATGNLVWAKQFSSVSPEFGRAVAVDAAGNVYVTGSFGGTTDFDPGPATHHLTTVGSWDIFIAKLDPSGNLVWAKRFGDGSPEDHGNAIAVDAAGNVYTTGSFKGTIDFDPGAGVVNLTAGYIDVYISKLDTDGNYLWAGNMGGTFTDIGYSIAVDAAGYIYSTGYFKGWADFDPGPGVHWLVYNSGDADVFISKIDPSGNLVWAKQVTADPSNFCYGYGITLDATGNVFITGSYHGWTDFDPGPGTFYMHAQGLTDGFVCKLNASGDFVWAKTLGGCQVDDYGTAIALDAFGNIYTTGVFQFMADFDPGPGVSQLHAAGGTDVFVSKLDASGNFVWARHVGGTNVDHGYSMAVDGSGNIFIAGLFEGNADFDPGSGTYVLSTPPGQTDAFILKLHQAVWNGSISNAWNIPANWNSGIIPGTTSDVVIPSGVSRYPTLSFSTNVKSLVVQNGALLTVSPGVQLTLNGQ